MQAGGTEPFEPELSSKRPDDSTVRQRLRESAAERRRFGYRRLGWLLVREGHVMNRKKLYRIYREEKPMVRRRGRRKRAIGTRAPLALPDTINQRWSLDFVSDALSDGRRFRIFAAKVCGLRSFGHLSLNCKRRRTRWRSEVNSNCWYRFVNSRTTASS